jgi:hypothetical protein
MIILRIIEILKRFLIILIMGGQWIKGLEFETDPTPNKWRKTFVPSFQKGIGFHNVTLGNRNSPLGFPSSFIPYRVSKNLSFSPHPRI